KYFMQYKKPLAPQRLGFFYWAQKIMVCHKEPFFTIHSPVLRQ
ncbi:MAG: hypothetical protein ACI9EP_000969, partial [Oceanospirillaceae bacterium]